jgi:predicted phage terminase large subunit-like protein
MQRLHEDDLAGHLLRQGGWDHLDMPAIALEDEDVDLGYGKTNLRIVGDVIHPEREDQSALDKIKREIGSLLFSAQYQQRPVPAEGNLVQRSWLRHYEPAELLARDRPSKIVQSWDVAMMTGRQNDYSVCTTWRADKNDVYLLDVFHGRLEYPDLRRKVIALAGAPRPTTILIEDVGPGMNLLQDLKHSMPTGLIRPIGVKPDGSKLERMAAQSAKIEAGQVHLPKSAPWLGDFLNEFLAFPNGRHDDQVDSVSQFLCWWQKDCARAHKTFVVPFAPTRARLVPY